MFAILVLRFTFLIRGSGFRGCFLGLGVWLWASMFVFLIKLLVWGLQFWCWFVISGFAFFVLFWEFVFAVAGATAVDRSLSCIRVNCKVNCNMNCILCIKFQ